MSARIVELAATRRASTARSDEMRDLALAATRLHFWRGASGRCYVHSVYGLVECPPVPGANYVLAGKDAAGRTIPLAVGRVAHEAPTLNLAEIRHRGARLGASEVHVHLLADGEMDASQIELDITSAFRPVSNGNASEPRQQPALAC